MAEAEAEALRRVAASLPDGQASMYLLGIKYLEALPRLAEGRGSTIFLPSEATGVMGALGGLREMLLSRGGNNPASSDESGRGGGSNVNPPPGAGISYSSSANRAIARVLPDEDEDTSTKKR
jgi:hypothetical protein